MESSLCSNDDPTGTLTSAFTVIEVASVCKTLKNNKAPGCDGISNECIKYGGHKLYVILSYIFNNIIRLGYVPPGFKHSIIVPLYKGKKKPMTEMTSYRGVSLTPVLNKVLEKLVFKRLTVWLRDQDFPPPLQQAGRTATNCVSLAYAVQEAITHVTMQGSKVYGCFLDIRSAYDVINWEGLLYKLYHLGITDKLWHFFKAWLQGSTAQVRVGDHCSDTFNITRSIKQGGVLSTFYFVVFYSDIHARASYGNTQYLQFHGKDFGSPTMADDTLLLSTTVNGLQNMISNVCLYGKQWRIDFSVNKTKCITFGEKPKHNCTARGRQWSMGDIPLEEVNSYMYLGILLSADGSTRQRTDSMALKAVQTYGALRAINLHSDGFSPVSHVVLCGNVCLSLRLFMGVKFGDLYVI